ncbi:MAG: nuclease-related domain-containing protein [Chloroflexota bacterium]
MRRLRLRYPGTCVRCGTSLAAGADALYDRVQKSVQCVSCPIEDGPGTATFDTGVAGASAQREYERRVAGRETRVKGRFGRRLGGAILALSDDPQSTRAWARGSEGEQELANALAGVEGIRVLHDRRVPGTRGNIDHIVIAPGGVFVIDAKRYEGTIRVRDVGGLFKRDERLYVGRRDCSRLAENMNWQVEAVEHALASVEPKPPPITPVLCFVRGEWPLLLPPNSYNGVRLEGTRSITKLVLTDQLLDALAIRRVTEVLSRHLPPK